MDEHQVRLLVRQAIARHMGGAPVPAPPPAPVRSAASPVAAAAAAEPRSAAGASAVSFAKFHLVRPAGETECVIEPTVTCNHCGHCLCYGH
jgi:hypothetical protein